MVKMHFRLPLNIVEIVQILLNNYYGGYFDRLEELLCEPTGDVTITGDDEVVIHEFLVNSNGFKNIAQLLCDKYSKAIKYWSTFVAIT